MAENCLSIAHQGETIQLSWQRGQAAPRFSDTVTFEHPFDRQAYGIFLDNAAKIEQRLQI